jgi:lactoylglutathione lyase
LKVNYAIVFVSDMKKSASFYRDVIGLPLKFETTHWTEFATDGAALVLHKSDAVRSPSENHNPEPAGSCRPGLQVPDLKIFHERMMGNGVTCIQEPKEVFGAMVAQYLDPDGLVISVGEEVRNS